jgi:hypothetical protein
MPCWRWTGAGGLGPDMQHYYFDICWDGETVTDDEGTSHYDDGSAVFYAGTVANRLARCGKLEAVRVHVRDDRGRLLSIVVPRACLSQTSQQSRLRAIVERDRARQMALAG